MYEVLIGFFAFMTFGSLIVCIVLNFLLFKYKPFNNEKYDELIDNWKKTPITSISYKGYNLNDFDQNIDRANGYIYSKMFETKHMDKKYNYGYFQGKTFDKNYHICAKGIYFPNEVECPINDIEITYNIFPSKNNINYKTIRLGNNLYLHYTNQNIYDGNIITDIKALIHYEFYSDRNFGDNVISSQFFPIPYRDYSIKFLYFHYDDYYDSNINTINTYYIALNVKSIRMGINVFTSIIYCFLFISTILIIAKEKFAGIQFINIFLGLLIFVLRFMIMIFIDGNEFLAQYRNIELEMSYEKNTTPEIDYNIALVGCTGGFLLFFSFLSATKTSNNIYYYMVYIIRYGINWDWDICNNCRKKRKEKLEKEINEIESEIRKLKNDLNECIIEKNEIEKENEKTLKLIEIMKKELAEKKANNINIINMNIEIKEEIEIEKEINNLIVIKDKEIEIYKKLTNEINKVEKEINFYKLKELKNNET